MNIIFHKKNIYGLIQMDDEKPKYIVLGPGGARGFYFLGVLHQLASEGQLTEVIGYSGSSVGAMIALLLTCGYTPVQIMGMAAETAIFTDFYNVKIGEKLLEMRSNYGITSNSAIRSKIERAVIDKYSRIVSMEDLYLMTGIDLVTVTYNIDTRRPVYMSHKSHPHLDVVTAVLLSINIPLLFYRMSYGGHTYIDGGFVDPLPIAPFDNGKDRVLAIYINTQINAPADGGSFLSHITTYIHHILTTSIHRVRDMIVLTSSPKCDFIEINSSLADTTGASFSVSDKANMILHGVIAANKYLDRPPVDRSGVWMYPRQSSELISELAAERVVKY